MNIYIYVCFPLGAPPLSPLLHTQERARRRAKITRMRNLLSCTCGSLSATVSRRAHDDEAGVAAVPCCPFCLQVLPVLCFDMRARAIWMYAFYVCAFERINNACTEVAAVPSVLKCSRCDVWMFVNALVHVCIYAVYCVSVRKINWCVCTCTKT